MSAIPNVTLNPDCGQLGGSSYPGLSVLTRILGENFRPSVSSFLVRISSLCAIFSIFNECFLKSHNFSAYLLDQVMGIF